MQYMGGKSRIARQIADFINEIPRRKVTDCQAPCPDNHGCGGGGADYFVSLFCGSCAVESKVQGFSHKILNDRHKYLIAMLQGVQSGYELPERITPENNFETIGLLWGVYLRAAHPELAKVMTINHITAKDVAAMMGLLKVARIKAGDKADSFVDLAGYAACAGEIATGGKEDPNV